MSTSDDHLANTAALFLEMYRTQFEAMLKEPATQSAILEWYRTMQNFTTASPKPQSSDSIHDTTSPDSSVSPLAPDLLASLTTRLDACERKIASLEAHIHSQTTRTRTRPTTTRSKQSTTRHTATTSA